VSKQKDDSKISNNSKGCFKCGRTKHLASECRASSWDQERLKASQQNGQQNNSKTPTKSVLVCRYCKKEGHESEVCRKRQYVNSKKQQIGKEAFNRATKVREIEENRKRAAHDRFSKFRALY